MVVVFGSMVVVFACVDQTLRWTFFFRLTGSTQPQNGDLAFKTMAARTCAGTPISNAVVAQILHSDVMKMAWGID